MVYFGDHTCHQKQHHGLAGVAAGVAAATAVEAGEVGDTTGEQDSDWVVSDTNNQTTIRKRKRENVIYELFLLYY